jgi:MoxR-like ATPase
MAKRGPATDSNQDTPKSSTDSQRPPDSTDDLNAIEALGKARDAIKAEVAKVIVGQDYIIDHILTAMFSQGHCLIIGVPGLAKTLMVRTISDVLDLQFNRIQFTPDLMPSDITGTDILQPERAGDDTSFKMVFAEGPVFANIVLADEINRTPPKTQAALLQSMQEYTVTSRGRTYKLPWPFFVLATQNPIEQEGTYPLPEAQLDRFMFNLYVEYPSADEELLIAKTTTGQQMPELDKVMTAETIIQLQDIVRRVPISDHVARYAVNVARASRPDAPESTPFVNENVAWGAGPRAVQYMVLGAKARCVLRGDVSVSCDDVRDVAPLVLRHRIITNFHAESEGIDPVAVVSHLLESVPEPGEAAYA